MSATSEATAWRWVAPIATSVCRSGTVDPGPPDEQRGPVEVPGGHGDPGGPDAAGEASEEPEPDGGHRHHTIVDQNGHQR